MLPPLPASAADAHERRAARGLVPGREVRATAPRRPTLLDVLEAARRAPPRSRPGGRGRCPTRRPGPACRARAARPRRRPAASSAPAPSSSAASAGRPRASPGSSRRASSPPASPGRTAMTTMPPTIAATPIRIRPGDRDVEPDDQRDDASDDREDALAGPARDDLARLLDQPAAVDDVLLERLVEVGDGRPELGQVVGRDVVAVLADRQLAQLPSATPRPGRSAAARCARAAPPRPRRRVGGLDVDADLLATSRAGRRSSRNAIRPATRDRASRSSARAATCRRP